MKAKNKKLKIYYMKKMQEDRIYIHTRNRKWNHYINLHELAIE